MLGQFQRGGQARQTVGSIGVERLDVVGVQDTGEKGEDGGVEIAQRPNDGIKVEVVVGVRGGVKGCEESLPPIEDDVGWSRLVVVESTVESAVVVAAQRVVVESGGELLPRLLALLETTRHEDGTWRSGLGRRRELGGESRQATCSW